MLVDLHCHLLPGIDDGPDTLEESLQLCQIAVESDISVAVVTPHIHPGRWENNRQSIAEQCSALQQSLVSKRIPLRLGFAGEVRLTEQVIDQVAQNQIPFYGELDGYHIMLLEFPHGHIIPGSDKLVQWLLDRRIRPLIAHPERNKAVMKHSACLLPFLEAGCLLQLTAGSLTGSFGGKAQAIAQQLLQDNVVAVVASDGHNAKARPPELKNAFHHIAEHYGQARAERLMIHTPATIVASQFVE
ncbi:MAG: tyrosine-protein phosphatase [Pseudomonadales bacterium]